LIQHFIHSKREKDWYHTCVHRHKAWETDMHTFIPYRRTSYEWSANAYDRCSEFTDELCSF